MNGWSLAIYAAFVAIGWAGVLVEFVRPGWVIPGAAGGVALVFGLFRLFPQHVLLAAAVSVPFLAIAFWMLAIGFRARRNKRTL
jgi:membrane-bound ClpP family serine protease